MFQNLVIYAEFLSANCNFSHFFYYFAEYIFSDVHDASRDAKLAKYVMNVHTGAGLEREADKDEIDLETLKK